MILNTAKHWRSGAETRSSFGVTNTSFDDFSVRDITVPRHMLHSPNHVHTWWRHQMETFSALLDLCAGNSPTTVEFPSQTPVTRSFDVSLICALNKRLSNNRETGHLRRHRAHYDVIVMVTAAKLHLSDIWSWYEMGSVWFVLSIKFGK